MSITSEEALSSVTEGQTIRVRSRNSGNQMWTRDSSGGFARDGAVVDAHFFVGYINEGRVERVDNSPATPGEWWQNNLYHYLITRRGDTEGTLMVRAYYRGRLRNEDVAFNREQFDPAVNPTMQRLEHLPDALVSTENMRGLFEFYHDYVSRLTVERDQAREAVSNKPPKDETPKAPAQERVIVTVEVTGTARVPEDIARAALLLPRDATVETVGTPFAFSYRYATMMQPGACACRFADRERVMARLPVNVVAWDMAVSCSAQAHDPNEVDEVSFD